MTAEVPGWADLRHGGLLLDAARLCALAEHVPPPLDAWHERELRRRSPAVLDGAADPAAFASFVLERVLGFAPGAGAWKRGSQVPPDEGRRALTGETVKPRQLWEGPRGARLPVFVDGSKRLGVGRGRRATSQVQGWLRAGGEPLAVVTNGRQWRLVFCGLDFDAWCEWDLELWLEEGGLAPQVIALRTLLQPALWTPPEDGAPPPLLDAIRASRKGQAELSQVLGERVRQAVELLIDAHGEALKDACRDVDPADVYRAACRVAMRLVVVLFAESRDLLPRDHALYRDAYGLAGLLEDLERSAARGRGRLARSWSAWPRVLALFRLVREGSHHPGLTLPAYGGDLFAAGDADAEGSGAENARTEDGVARALSVFENACFEREVLSDRDVHRILDLLTRTKVRLRQGRASTWVPAPVDFAGLSTEYIGILYEGLLDFELRAAPPGDPVVFLAVGHQPALPLSRLEAMDDRALKDLFEKLADAGSGADEGDAGEEEGADGDADGGGSGEEAAAETDSEAEEAVADARHATRTRAETWARRAALAAKLVRKPRGKDTPERRLAYEETLARKARQLVERVVLPGEWYLVRWGGTRKGSGTFYTRPGLAVPTVQRTLRPLAYDPPPGPDGAPDRDAPPAAWTPKVPEAILALRVCDPACGSGTFPVAALRFLTEALYESLHHHGRIDADGGRSIVRLLSGTGDASGELLAEELIPCRPTDDEFEPRLKAVLRRHVVERCIYGVDLDPLAVELCRLALWIETMDRELPFSFLDHKIRPGNALVGAWFDTFRHYPAMAWKNREGGDQGHSNGVHFQKGARTKAIKTWVKTRLVPDLRELLEGATLYSDDLLASAARTHERALAGLERVHRLSVRDAAEHRRIWREEVVGSADWKALKASMDLWCACWFWPADELDRAPLPTSFGDPPEATRAVAARIAARKRFFHWELEFPDVFRAAGSGFDAVLGNPPWETLQPNSKEYFSNIDPLYRSYGKQEALGKQKELFRDSKSEESEWLDYTSGFANDSHWMKHAASPFGDPEESDKPPDRFTVARGRENAALHARWRGARARAKGFCDPEHPFRHRGEGKAYTYKLFLEAAHALLRPGGRLGFVVPSGLYSDHGTGALRRLFLERCRWEWLFVFENREKIFDIDSRFKFNPIVVEKGGRTEAIHTAFMRRRLEDWEHAEKIAIPYSLEQVVRFSPRSRAILEIQSARDLEILEKIYANSVLLGDDGPDGWGVRYAQGDFNMTSDSKLFPPRPKWEAKGYRPDEYSRWLLGPWRPIDELWTELGVDPAHPEPAAIELEDWLFDTTATPERRTAEARRAHGHLLKPGDVARTEWTLRCAQPPYDRLPIPRADLPPGIVLSRESDAWMREEEIEDVALPLYVGKMIRSREWTTSTEGPAQGRLEISPDYLIREHSIPEST